MHKQQLASCMPRGAVEIVEFPQWKPSPAYGKSSGVLARILQSRYQKYSKYLKYPSHSGRACGRKSLMSNRLKRLLRWEHFYFSSSSSSSSSIHFPRLGKLFPETVTKLCHFCAKNYFFGPGACPERCPRGNAPTKTQPFPHRESGGRASLTLDLDPALALA
jgi:hypothetical protein